MMTSNAAPKIFNMYFGKVVRMVSYGSKRGGAHTQGFTHRDVITDNQTNHVALFARVFMAQKRQIFAAY